MSNYYQSNRKNVGALQRKKQSMQVIDTQKVPFNFDNHLKDSQKKQRYEVNNFLEKTMSDHTSVKKLLQELKRHRLDNDSVLSRTKVLST